MDNRIPPFRPDVIAVQSAPRPTPASPTVNFSAVLAKGARGLVAGAEAALNVLPGGPLMAVAVRGGASGIGATHTMMSGPAGGTSGATSAEGPSAPATGASGGAGTPSDGGIESSLQQSQEMNMYYLQIQEQVNAQNRTFSALSNVLKAEHDTVKTAIGNIR